MKDLNLDRTFRMSALTVRYLKKDLTPDEQQELELWIKESEYNRQQFEMLVHQREWELALQNLGRYDVSAALTEVKRRIAMPAEQPRQLRWPYWAAAAVVLLLGTTLFKWLGPDKKQAGEPTNKLTVQNTPPASKKVRLVLGNGTDIFLDKKSDSTFILKGSVQAQQQNGVLTYMPTGTGTINLQYNTLITPNGEDYQLILPDGTKVWMNAASSLYYPTVFAGRERRVELKGEAYFEVAGNSELPFVVTMKNVDIQVLGTTFNVNAYTDEQLTTTTLLEGSVKVLPRAQPGSGVILQPGQQMLIGTNGNAQLLKTADAQQAIAWRNGLFSFKGADIHTIMRQLARWYDIDVAYEGQINDQFYVEMRKDMNIVNVLKVLETAGDVHFSIEGRKITVRP